MANVAESINAIMKINGALAASIVDASNGLMLGARGIKGFDLEYASAGNTELYHTKRKIMKALNIDESIEDLLITLETQYHILMPIPGQENIFVYFILSKTDGILGLARRQLMDIARQLTI